MEKQRIDKAELANRLETSRSAIDRILDPSTLYKNANYSQNLQLLSRCFMSNKLLAIALPVLHFSACGGIETKNGSISVAERGFSERWHDFREDARHLPMWTPDWKEEELKIRFDQMHVDRWAVYFTNPEECMEGHTNGCYRELYRVPEDWKAWGSRCSYPGAFCYNVASPSYNASVITLHGKSFLAMEAPGSGNLDTFCGLLTQFNVTDLIRLTSAMEGTRENSYPYWEGHINIHPKTARPTIELDGREMNYFCTDLWENHEGIESGRLIALVKAVMANDGPEQMIAVHCRAGVGRTGTFLAAYALIRDIDEQIASGVPVDDVRISVDKVVWELSLQRPFMVVRFSQYVSLYRLVTSYMEFLKKPPFLR